MPTGRASATRHTGTETLPRLLQEAAVEESSRPMGASLTERRRVEDEGLSGCKLLSRGGRPGNRLDRSLEEARAKFVPAAAVRRTVRTGFGITGLKARVGGWGRRSLKSPGSTGERAPKRPVWRDVGGPGTSGGAVKCVEIGWNARGESESPGRLLTLLRRES